MKKIAFTFLFILGSTIISCIREKCPYVEPYFQITSLTSSNLKFTNEGLNPWIALLENDTIQWENYFIRAGFISDYIASSSNNDLSFSGSSLFALSCDEPRDSGSKIGVKNVHIVTLSNYDSLYSKNDTIDSIVRLNTGHIRLTTFQPLFQLMKILNKIKPIFKNNSLNLSWFHHRIVHFKSHNSK